ncbi:hypothetical protein AMATHDRAFT_2410 [Amanita thiersii Skay4041]|uniref:F-box domain-containing protein n=1 Tax=Amanita thiersii Skay4041 TaxID=703135 RepID=A0A2A9NS45_9AGAR|nr:hypothetical protein AMATHDRAFT_2410 [Amanita thiersii Skay4041]
MTLTLSDVPKDILLYLVQFFEVEDAISFSMVCRGMHELTMVYERSFWTKTLNKTRLSRPIPCPLHEDLTNYSADSLRQMALRFNRLNRNWRQEEPVLMAPIKKLKVDSRLDSLAQIPGTPYVVMHSVRKAQLLVWSLEDGLCLASIPAHARIMDLSPGWTEPRKFTLALIGNQDQHATVPSELVVLTVEYTETTVSMTITFRYSLEYPERCYWAVFLNAEVAGVLHTDLHQIGDDPLQLYALALNRFTGRRTEITASVLPQDMMTPVLQEGQSGTSFWGDNLYIHFEYDDYTYQRSILRDLLPYNDNMDIGGQVNYSPATRHLPPIYHQPHMGFQSAHCEAILTTNSNYGVLAVTLYTVDDPVFTTSVTLINYWVVDSLSLEKTGELGFPVPSLYPHTIVPGRIKASTLSTWYLCHSSNSGLYTIVLVDIEGTAELVMVHLQLPNLVFTVHQINVPRNIKLEYVSGFFVDEQRGSVTLYQAKGRMFVLEYA